MGSLYALVTTLSTATAQVSMRRDATTQAAMEQAKAALIAWAALNPNRPGALPCPDTNNDGLAEPPVGGACPQYVGRLPWATLGLPDLRDGAGELLWYALAQPFTNDPGAGAINSDTQGTLSVAGTAPAANLIAIVFAPGPALVGQDRSAAGVNNVANYLDGGNAVATTNFRSGRWCERGTECPGGIPFNDELATITHAELFNVVENVVAKRIQAEVVPQIQAHLALWGGAIGTPPSAATKGFYPFAAPFDDQSQLPTLPTDPSRSQNRYQGLLGQTNGLLPVTRDNTTWMVWDNLSCQKVGGGFASQFQPPASPTDCAATCSASATGLVCNFFYSGGGFCDDMNVRVSGRVRNVALSFALPVSGQTASLSVSDSLTQQLETAGGNPTGNLNVQYDVGLPHTCTPKNVVITVPTPQFQAWTDATVVTNWFVRNRWYSQVYYAASPGYVPTAAIAAGAGGTCTVAGTPTCITVSNWPATPTNDKRAILVLAGRNLAGGARTFTIANYFEGANSVATPSYTTPAPDYLFQWGLRSPVFNDKVVVVAP